MRFQFANRASTHLAAPLANDGEYLTVAAGQGDRFPAALVEAPFRVTLVAVDGTSEIMECDGRSGDVLHVQRGLEGSPVAAFTTGDLVEQRLTAGVMDNFLQLGGGTLAGDLNLGGHNIVSANLLGAPSIDFVKTHGTYPLDGNFAGAIEYLNGGVHPRINGVSILTTVLLQQAIFMWWGRADQLPAHLKLCDGSLGTPDLRGRFILPAFNDDELGSFGGQFHWRTFGVGDHDHGGGTKNAALGSFNLPGLSAPSLSTTQIGLKVEAVAAGTADTFKRVVATAAMAGGGSYLGSAEHAHGIFPQGAHDHEFDAVPPYFRLHFVMFRSLQVN